MPFRPVVVLGVWDTDKRYHLVRDGGCVESLMIPCDGGISRDVEEAKKRAYPDLEVEHWTF